MNKIELLKIKKKNKSFNINNEIKFIFEKIVIRFN